MLRTILAFSLVASAALLTPSSASAADLLITPAIYQTSSPITVEPVRWRGGWGGAYYGGGWGNSYYGSWGGGYRGWGGGWGYSQPVYGGFYGYSAPVVYSAPTYYYYQPAPVYVYRPGCCW